MTPICCKLKPIHACHNQYNTTQAIQTKCTTYEYTGYWEDVYIQPRDVCRKMRIQITCAILSGDLLLLVFNTKGCTLNNIQVCTHMCVNSQNQEKTIRHLNVAAQSTLLTLVKRHVVHTTSSRFYLNLATTCKSQYLIL